jgi:hypothetical protein
MEEHNNQQDANQFGQQQPGTTGQQQYMLVPVPNSTAVLVLGIISIATCWCYGIIGLILSIIALVLSGSGKKAYLENPGKYTPGSYSNLKAGRICAIIGLSVSALYIIFVIFYLFAIFSFLSPGMMDVFDNFNSFRY